MDWGDILVHVKTGDNQWKMRMLGGTRNGKSASSAFRHTLRRSHSLALLDQCSQILHTKMCSLWPMLGDGLIR